MNRPTRTFFFGFFWLFISVIALATIIGNLVHKTAGTMDFLLLPLNLFGFWRSLDKISKTID